MSGVGRRSAWRLTVLAHSFSPVSPPSPSALFSRIDGSLGPAYTLKRELAGGGMSHVFLAEETSLGREVVIKVLQLNPASGVSAERFAREMRMTAQLQQANIVPVLSAGETAGLPYYSMPFVAGQSLRALLDERTQLSIAETIAITTDVAKALAYAHARGIVHRDIKPANILLSGGTAMVTDFGIAKALSESRAITTSDTLTEVGTSIGTPAYMAPEQALGDPSTDHRADLYALGVTMYEMLAGERPFRATVLHDLVRAHMTQEPTPIAVRRPDVPDVLADAVMHCLKKDPADRPASADALLAELGRTETGVTRMVQPNARARRSWTAAAAGVAAVAVIGAAAAVVAGRKGAAESDTIDPARVLLVAPTTDGGDASLSAIAAQAGDAIARALQSLPSVRHIELVPVTTTEDAARRRAGEISARTVLTGVVSPLGRDSARLRFRVLDAKTGDLVRAVRPIDVPRIIADSGMRAALDPAFSTLAIVTAPPLGAAALPLGDAPTFSAARELATALEIGAADSVKRALALDHFDRAVAADNGYFQARLWQAQFVQDNFPPTYFPRSRAIGDSVMRELAPRMDRLSSLERALYDYIVTTHSGRVPEAIAALRRLRAIAPQTPPAAALPRILMDQNRPREALALIKSMPAARDVEGKLVPPKDDPLRWSLIAAIDHFLGDRGGNVEAANELRRLAPDNMASVRTQLIAAAWDGDSVHVHDLLSTARSLPPRAGSYDFFGDLELQAAQELIAHGHAVLGRQLLQDAIAWLESRTGDDRRVTHRKALAYYAVPDYPKAKAALSIILRIDSTSTQYIGLAGRIAARTGDTVEALRRSNQLAQMRDPGLLGAPSQERSFIAAGLGHKAEAVALLEEAFAQGIGWNIWWRLHWFPDTQQLRGYGPFEKLLEPKG